MLERINDNGAAREEITLGDFHILLKEAFTVRPTDTLEYAVEVMDHHNVDQLPVVAASDHGVMVVTRRMIGKTPLSTWGEVLVQDALKEHSNDQNQRVRATTSLTEATELLIKYDWLLTTDKDDNPVGLATVGDALNALQNQLYA